MAKAKRIPSKIRRKHTNIVIQIHKPYILIPYRLLRSESFKSLMPEANKIYTYLLSQWENTEAKYNKPIPLSYTRACELCGCGNHTIVRANSQLIKEGFVTIIKEYRRTNRYLLELKWLDGKYQ